jgi:hypothetical protein
VTPLGALPGIPPGCCASMGSTLFKQAFKPRANSSCETGLSLRLGLQPYLVAKPWRDLYCQSLGLTISVSDRSSAEFGSVAAIFTGVAPLALFRIKSLVPPVTGDLATSALLGAAITLVVNSIVLKSTEPIDPDFQTADDIWVVLLKVKFTIFKLTGVKFRAGGFW